MERTETLSANNHSRNYSDLRVLQQMSHLRAITVILYNLSHAQTETLKQLLQSWLRSYLLQFWRFLLHFSSSSWEPQKQLSSECFFYFSPLFCKFLYSFWNIILASLPSYGLVKNLNPVPNWVMNSFSMSLFIFRGLYR